MNFSVINFLYSNLFNKKKVKCIIIIIKIFQFNINHLTLTCFNVQRCLYFNIIKLELFHFNFYIDWKYKFKSFFYFGQKAKNEKIMMIFLHIWKSKTMIYIQTEDLFKLLLILNKMLWMQTKTDFCPKKCINRSLKD